MGVINSNISALRAQASLSANQVNLSKAMERLSTGVRINSAKDDAAGLAISNRMTTDIRGYAVAMRNANDGISLTQVAEGHLAQITDNLQRIRELAVQSANASNSTADRQVLNLEATQLVAEIDRIANNSQFNTINLLDGTFVNKDFQIGSGNKSSDRINLGIASAKAGSLGVGSGSSYATKIDGAAVGGTALADGSLSINGYAIGAAQQDGVSYPASGSNASGLAVAAAINAASDLTKVSAQTNATTVQGVAAASTSGYSVAVTSGDILINGVNLGAIRASGSAVERGAAVTAAVNKITAQTGVTATFSTSTGAVALTAADGRNITVESSGTSTGTQALNLAATGLTGKVGTLTSGTVTTGAISSGDFLINGVDIGAVAAGTDATGQAINIAAAVNAVTAQTGVSATNTAGVVTLSTTGGRINIFTSGTTGTLTLTGFAVGTTESKTITRSAVTLISNNQAGITVSTSTGGALSAAGLTNVVGYKAATATAGAGVSSLDLSTVPGSQNALNTLDAAISTVNQTRAQLGAYQNRLQFAVSDLQIGSDNLSASRSRILDTDYAAETTNLAKSQIVSQAATAMLAQANQQPQTVLALLK